MRESNWTPSIVPRGDDHNVYLVMDDLGRVWREADVENTDFETVIADLLDGQYRAPIGIFCFNSAEGWSRDVSEDIATNSAGAAIWKTGTCPKTSGISSSATRRICTANLH
jgi:hypothetical protein